MCIRDRPWTAKRVGDLLMNNALFILMFIAIVYIAMKNPNFLTASSIINILSQTAAYPVSYTHLDVYKRQPAP